MKTKAQIVQELLEKDAITAEDAVVLLMADERVAPVYLTYPQPYPFWPWHFGTPNYQMPGPFSVGCTVVTPHMTYTT